MAVYLQSEIGTELHLELDGTEGRVLTTLIGVAKNKLLIISIPEKLALQLGAEDSLPEATLRGISRGQAFGFKVPALRVLSEPDALLILDYPSSIQIQAIRKNRRVKCLLPAKFGQDTTGVPGVIADLSNSGCHFQASSELNDHQKAIVQLGQVVLMSFALPGREAPKTIEAVVRNTYVNDATIHIGFEFRDVDSATKNVLDEFIALSFEIQPY